MTQLKTNKRVLAVFWLQVLPQSFRHTNCILHSLDTRGEVLAITSEHSENKVCRCKNTNSFQHAVEHFEKGMLTTLQTNRALPQAGHSAGATSLLTATLRHPVLQTFVYQIGEGNRRVENAKSLSSATLNIGNFWLKKHAEWTGQDVLCNSFFVFYFIKSQAYVTLDFGFCFV